MSHHPPTHRHGALTVRFLCDEHPELCFRAARKHVLDVLHSRGGDGLQLGVRFLQGAGQPMQVLDLRLEQALTLRPLIGATKGLRTLRARIVRVEEAASNRTAVVEVVLAA